jgi:3-(3-hydroxy-phenyl)propionate hydroxylase
VAAGALLEPLEVEAPQAGVALGLLAEDLPEPAARGRPRVEPLELPDAREVRVPEEPAVRLVFKVPDEGPPGLWRAAFPCHGDRSDDELLSEQNVESRMQGLVARPERYDIRYKSIYRVHQRVAKDFRQGRVLLAGDAAHLNNPVGGFGLNSGIHDAVNLSEKLIQVWRGEADESLLDRYVRQRRATCIDEVQRMSIRNKRLLEERDPAVQRQHLTELVAVANDPERARKHMLETSMISGARKAAEIA